MSKIAGNLNEPVAVALSGGLDSSMAAWFLKQEGCDVIGVHARFIGNDEDFVSKRSALEVACAFLDIPLYVFDLRQKFYEHVITPFIETYVQGRTPNPCALCNPYLKFGLLWSEARKVGAKVLASGHYARIDKFKPDHEHSFTTIFPAADPLKDQSYFLALVGGRDLEHVVFPLAERSKEDLRSLAAQIGLPIPQPKESQEICFVPNDDYRAFLEASGAKLPKGGQVRLVDGTIIGTHKGLWQYTEGQRRGLGIAWSEPLYVIGKDMTENLLLVGGKEHLACFSCIADNLNVLVPAEYWPEQVYVRVRYRQKSVPAKVIFADARMHIQFAQVQDPPAKGQLAVVYHPQGFVLAGGIIC